MEFGYCFVHVNFKRILCGVKRGPARVNSDKRHGPKSSDST